MDASRSPADERVSSTLNRLRTATAARDFATIFEIIRDAPTATLLSDVTALGEAVSVLPAEMILSDPVVLISASGRRSLDQPSEVGIASSSVAGRALTTDQRERILLLQMGSYRLRGQIGYALETADRLRRSLRTSILESAGDIPPHFALYYSHLGMTELLAGNTSQALAEFASAAGVPEGVGDLGASYRRNTLGKLALTSAIRGAVPEAEQFLRAAQELPEGSDPAGRFARYNEQIAARLISIEATGRALDQEQPAPLAHLHNKALWPAAMLAAAREAFANGAPGTALETVRSAESTHPIEAGSLAADLVSALTIKALLLLGEVPAARTCADACTRPGPFTEVALVRLTLYEGQFTAVARASARLFRQPDLSLAQSGDLLLLQLWAEHIMANRISPGAASVVAWLATRGRRKRIFTTVPRSVILAIAAALSQNERAEFESAMNGLEFAPELAPRLRLSRREREVLAAIAKHGTIAATARSLFVSANTIKTQLTSIYRKLDVSDRLQAIAAAERLRLFDDERTGESDA